jgi:hypothetical protein
VGNFVQIGPASESGGCACGLAAAVLVVGVADEDARADDVAFAPELGAGVLVGGAEVSGRSGDCVEVATPVAVGAVAPQAQSNPASAARTACARWRRETNPISAQAYRGAGALPVWQRGAAVWHEPCGLAGTGADCGRRPDAEGHLEGHKP